MRSILGVVSGLFLTACGQSHEAIGACEVFIKERLRSPATYERIEASFSGLVTETDGKKVKTVFIEYDAENAFGTPIRSNEMCQFQVKNDGSFMADPVLSAEMSAINGSEFAVCCLLEDRRDVDALAKSSDAAAEAADAAMRAAEGAK